MRGKCGGVVIMLGEGSFMGKGRLGCILFYFVYVLDVLCYEFGIKVVLVLIFIWIEFI